MLGASINNKMVKGIEIPLNITKIFHQRYIITSVNICFWNLYKAHRYGRNKENFIKYLKRIRW
jgi:hypothetical protein